MGARAVAFGVLSPRPACTLSAYLLPSWQLSEAISLPILSPCCVKWSFEHTGLSASLSVRLHPRICCLSLISISAWYVANHLLGGTTLHVTLKNPRFPSSFHTWNLSHITTPKIRATRSTRPAMIPTVIRMRWEGGSEKGMEGTLGFLDNRHCLSHPKCLCYVGS